MTTSDRFHAIVPLKTLDSAKSRLAPGMDLTQRIVLLERMLNRVLRACNGARLVNRLTIVVEGPFPDTRAMPSGTYMVRQPGSAAGLNDGLCAALDRLAPECGGGVAIVMADLPALTAKAVDAALRRLPPGRAALVATDQHGEGTSLLAWRGGAFRDFRYGAGSRIGHWSALRAAGFAIQDLSPHPAFHDLDTPSDADAVERCLELTA